MYFIIMRWVIVVDWVVCPSVNVRILGRGIFQQACRQFLVFIGLFKFPTRFYNANLA